MGGRGGGGQRGPTRAGVDWRGGKRGIDVHYQRSNQTDVDVH